MWWLKAIFYLFLAIILFAFIKEVLPIGASGLQIFLIVLFGLILIVVNSFFYLGIRQVGLFLGFEPEIRNNNAKKIYSIPKNEHAQLRNKLLNYIEEEKPYQKFELSLNELAENLDTSSRKLSFLINSEFKQNFFEFINSYRINEAKKLLTETNSSIKEIMYDSGFGNKSTFNSIFKKQTGFSPSIFRNNMKTKS